MSEPSLFAESHPHLYKELGRTTLLHEDCLVAGAFTSSNLYMQGYTFVLRNYFTLTAAFPYHLCVRMAHSDYMSCSMLAPPNSYLDGYKQGLARVLTIIDP